MPKKGKKLPIFQYDPFIYFQSMCSVSACPSAGKVCSLDLFVSLSVIMSIISRSGNWKSCVNNRWKESNLLVGYRFCTLSRR
mmetsp:Transcript_11948/g.17813  ORF Transcript_11948/g.17813 Transcript_11948/m.17813 type:complete len:82 (+) Transcript_11948:381-626(+)